MVIVIQSAGLYPQKDDIKFERWYEGLSQKSVLCISQDSKGFMWFCTYDGLHRFDGYKVKVYKSDIGDPSSLSNNTVRFIYEDRSHWPTSKMPLRPPMSGERHLDVVPVCYV